MFLSPTAALEMLTLWFYSPHRHCVPLSHCGFRNADTGFICLTGPVFLSPTAALETLTLCFYSPHRPCVPLSHCSFRNIDTLFPMASQALYAYDISHCSFRNRDTMFLFASQAAYSCLWITALEYWCHVSLLSSRLLFLAADHSTGCRPLLSVHIWWPCAVWYVPPVRHAANHQGCRDVPFLCCWTLRPCQHVSRHACTAQNW